MINKFFKNIENIIYKPNVEIPVSFIKKKLNKKRKTKDNKIDRINIVMGFSVFILSVLILRVLILSINLNFFKSGKELKQTVLKTKVRRDIVDRNGDLIASDLPILDVYANPKKILFPEKTAQELCEIFTDLNYDSLINNFYSKKKFIYIQRRISPEEKKQVLKIGDPGLEFLKRDLRFYPLNNLFSHIIGYVDVDNTGLAGIEKSLERKIADQKKGDNIALSIDASIQEVVRNNLINDLKKYEANEAYGIIMNVKTGEILAMVSLPDFHPKNAAKALQDKRYNNHVTLDIYEQGSTFKTFNIALAIENGFMSDPDLYTYNISEPLRIGSFKIEDDIDDKEDLTIPEILTYSSNVGSARVALKLGKTKQKAFFKKLGFFEKINLEIPEIGSPMYPSNWDRAMLATASYGYGISVSPLHVISAFSSVINDGIYKKPTLLKIKENSLFEKKKKEKIKTVAPPVYQARVITPKTSSMMRKLLRLVVMKGTAKRANIEEVKIGGKTGTVKKYEDGEYQTGKFRTSFLSAFPIDNPKYSMLVMFDEPKSNDIVRCNASSCNAVPTSANIIKEIAPLLNIE